MKSHRILWVVLLAVVAGGAMTGCDSPADNTQQLVTFLQAQRRPVASQEYRVYPPDRLALQANIVEEVNDVTRQVMPDGTINLPMIGEVFVAGMTPKEIEKAIAKAAGEYYERVGWIHVQVAGYNSQRIYVLGEVNRPGPRPYTGRDTVLDVLSEVGTNVYSWGHRVRVLRPTRASKGGFMPESEEKEEQAEEEDGYLYAQVVTVNLWEMAKHGDLSRNVYLQPDDIIYVPPHPAAAVAKELQRWLLPVSPVLEAARAPATLMSTGDQITDFDDDDDD